MTAVDTSRKLLDELDARRGRRPIVTVEGDITDIAAVVEPDFDVVVCMGDTLTHLASPAAVQRLFEGVAGMLVPSGLFVLTFRNLTVPLTGTDRFIPVRSDGDRIMTCFLEYEPDTVLVHDLIHIRRDTEWMLSKSSYRKLRLAPPWVASALEARGLSILVNELSERMVTIAARRS